MRATRQRSAIMDILTKADRHPTADEVFEQARHAIPGISLGTVYRLLSSMVKDGTVKLLTTGHGPRHYDASTRPHHHIVCIRCGRVDDVPGLLLPGLREQVEARTGYAITDAHIRWEGRCPACRCNEDRITNPVTNS